MMNPIVSIILPVYNAAPYLHEAVESVLNQTLDDLEIIAIDDGSTDDSLNILKSFSEQDSRVKVFSRENRGISYTLNEAASLSSGKYIARMDADDICAPERIAKQVFALEAEQSDICGTWCTTFGYANELIRYPLSDTDIKLSMIFNSPFCHPSVMFKKEVFETVHYDSDKNGAEDYDFWIRAAHAGFKMANVAEPLLFYRVHEGQVSVTGSHKQIQISQVLRQDAVLMLSNLFDFSEEDFNSFLWPRFRFMSKLELDRFTASAVFLVNNLVEDKSFFVDRISTLFGFLSGFGAWGFYHYYRFIKSVGAVFSIKYVALMTVFYCFRIKYGSKRFLTFYAWISR